MYVVNDLSTCTSVCWDSSEVYHLMYLEYCLHIQCIVAECIACYNLCKLFFSYSNEYILENKIL